MRVGIVDYGAGNLESVRSAVLAVGGEPTIVRSCAEVLAVDRLILPGVGAAGVALEHLRSRGLDQALFQATRVQARPLLGICLGLQLLADDLQEFGKHQGLGWIGGSVVWLGSLVGGQVRVPHAGWNHIDVTDDATVLSSLRGTRQFYFSHSYALVPTDPSIVVATTEHGVPLVAAIQDQTILATQFHPEKSQINGALLLQAFLDWSP